MHTRHALALTLALSAPALAQQTAVTLDDVTVKGASELLGSFVKASLNAQPGAALSSINLRQVEQDALATGYLKTASAELQTVGTQNVLVVTVTPNPDIHAVSVSGVTFLPAEGFKTSLANVLNIAPGATLNTVRIEQSKEALAQNYRAEGYPFAPSISTETKPAANGTVDLTYVVDESAPVRRIEVTGSTLLPKDRIVAAFQPLYDAKKFTADAYFAAIQQIQQAYQQAGVLASGVNVQASSLEDGVLKVSVLEGQVAGTDLTDLALSGAAPALATRAGSVPSLRTIEQDVRTLSNLTGKSVGFALAPPDPQAPNRVTVKFGVAEAATGPIQQIRIVGNTAVPTAPLQASLKTRVGDIFSRQLAESDFVALREVYRKAGYDVSTRNAVSFDAGVLTYTLHEAKIAGYQLQFTGKQRTQARVISRELPKSGAVYNDKAFRDALERVTRLGLVKITGVTTKALDPKNPENLTYVLGVSEVAGTRSFPIGLQYDSLSGFSGSLGLENNNVFGLGNTLSVNVGASRNDAGQVFSGTLGYTIPWLDIDFADFREKRTSVSFSVASNVTGNNPVLDATSTDTGRDYTVRTSGLGVSVGRSLTPSLGLSASVNTSYNSYYLEPVQKADVSSTDDVAAAPLVPPSSLTTVVGAALRYDTTTSPDFPTSGLRANVYAGYGFGRSGTTPLGWTKLEGGASTYFGLGRTLEKGFGSQQKQQAFAVRLNAGTLLGTTPPGLNYAIGYSNTNPAYELRGYDAAAFRGSNYLTSSAEYRYDFNLGGSIAQGLYGIAFVDAGSAWNTGSPINVGLSLGLGAQLNLGFNNSPLATVRFDYGFSPATGSGKFHFRLGPVW